MFNIDQNTYKSNQDDEDTISREEWNPNRAQIDAYLEREVSMAKHNLLMTLRASRHPMSVKDMKDASLHSVETLDEALTLLIEEEIVQEIPGKFTYQAVR